MQTNYTWMQWHKYREKHDNKLLFKCIFIQCTNKGTQTQEKTKHITIRDTKEKS